MISEDIKSVSALEIYYAGIIEGKKNNYQETNKWLTIGDVMREKHCHFTVQKKSEVIDYTHFAFHRSIADCWDQ